MRNKKIIICLISFLVIVGLVVCFSFINNVNKNDTPLETESPSTEVVIEDTTLVLKGPILERYKDVDSSDISKFLATLIVKVKPEEYQEFNYPIISNTEENSNIILALLHLNVDMLEEYAVAATLNNTSAYTVGIVRPKMGYEEAIISELSLRISDLQKALKNYPDQLYLVENHRIEQIGDYFVIIVCDNQDMVYDELYKVMGNLDLSTVVSVPMLTEEERKAIETAAYSAEDLVINSEVEDVIVTPVEPSVMPSVDPEIDPETSPSGEAEGTKDFVGENNLDIGN